jgi:hypothetical protein
MNGYLSKTSLDRTDRKIGKIHKYSTVPGRFEPTAKVFRLMFVLGPETGKVY